MMHSANFNFRLYGFGHIVNEKKPAGSIPNGRLIQLFLVTVSVLVYQKPWYVLSCMWDGAYERFVATNSKE